MTLDHTICPHCGCHCEDNEFCAACGRLFHEEEVHAASRKVSLFGFFESGLRSLFRKTPNATPEVENDDFFSQNSLLEQADQETDPSWSFLSSNIHNNDHD